MRLICLEKYDSFHIMFILGLMHPHDIIPLLQSWHNWNSFFSIRWLTRNLPWSISLLKCRQGRENKAESGDNYKQTGHYGNNLNRGSKKYDELRIKYGWLFFPLLPLSGEGFQKDSKDGAELVRSIHFQNLHSFLPEDMHKLIFLSVDVFIILTSGLGCGRSHLAL